MRGLMLECLASRVNKCQTNNNPIVDEDTTGL